MDFVTILSIFVLACFVGYYVVWSVTPALHTPLMAVTNAISSVIIVGALIAAAAGGSPSSKWLGLVAVALASVNIFGGFAVTARMLAMYKKKDRSDACGRRRPRLGADRLPRLGNLLHSRPARLVEPGDQPARQPSRHDRHGDRGRDNARHPRRSLHHG